MVGGWWSAWLVVVGGWVDLPRPSGNSEKRRLLRPDGECGAADRDDLVWGGTELEVAMVWASGYDGMRSGWDEGGAAPPQSLCSAPPSS